MADKDVAAPVLWLLAGPNGAGKTSYYDQFVAGVFAAPFVNADRIAETMLGRHPRNAREMRAATTAASRLRQQLLSERRSFVAETVFSHLSKIELMQAAREAGYYLRLSYIGVDDPALCALRVQERVLEGGHPVPPDRIAARYARSLENAKNAVTLAHWAIVLDNSSLDQPHRPVLVYEQGTLRGEWQPLPRWVRAFPSALT